MYATRCSVAFMLALACLMGQHLCKEDNQLATDESDKEEGNDTLLYIGAIFPMTGESWQGGQGSKPAVDMALKDVNDRPDMLPGYKLNMVWNDSECNPGLGTNLFYNLLYTKPTKIMMLTGCSAASTPVAEAAHMWNLNV
ncbi:putative gamma-aminobutyric acid type B receptor subunit 1-like, partial [Apostichopus japonicus]